MPPAPKSGPSIEPLLEGYVAGGLDPWLHALIESHLLLSPENRDRVRALEAAAGEAIEAGEPAPFRRAARDHVLSAIYAGGWYGEAKPKPLDPVLPRPIARLVGKPYGALDWRFRAPGLREHLVHDDGRMRASLLIANPGGALPAHAHEGLEATLVLDGVYSDARGDYARGDVALVDESVEHRPQAGPDEPCLCFVVSDGAIRLTSPIGRLVQRIFGIR